MLDSFDHAGSRGVSILPRVPGEPEDLFSRPLEGNEDLVAAWRRWREEQTPRTNAAMLRAIDPIISRAAAANAPGRQVNPLTRSRARAIALRSLASFNPDKGRLETHIYNHMQGLKRYAAASTAGIRVPERVLLDRRAVLDTEAELTAELGREPTEAELGDRLGMTLERMRRARRASPAMSTGFFQSLGEDGGPYDPSVAGSPGSDAWLRIVYDDLAPLDKKVFEWSLGFNGAKKLQTTEIARRLRRSPGWVSQRRAAIQKLMDEEADLSPYGV